MILNVCLIAVGNEPKSLAVFISDILP